MISKVSKGRYKNVYTALKLVVCTIVFLKMLGINQYLLNPARKFPLTCGARMEQQKA